MKTPEIVIIAALGQRGEIGHRNQLPWRLPDDLKRFKALTLGNPVVMGRNTWLALGERPLGGRRNVVISTTLPPLPRTPLKTDLSTAHPTTLERYASLASAFAALQEERFIYIIGGAHLYKAALPYADRLELTEIRASFEADAFFPSWPREEFVRSAYVEHPADARHLHAFAFATYVRRL